MTPSQEAKLDRLIALLEGQQPKKVDASQCLLSTSQVAKRYRIAYKTVKQDCEMGKLKVSVRKARSGKRCFMVDPKSAEIVYGAS